LHDIGSLRRMEMTMPDWRRYAPALCWIMVGASAVFAVIRVFGLERTWYVTVVMAFTPYLMVVSLVPLIFALAWRRWRAFTVAALATLALTAGFVPRAIGHPDPGRGPVVRVMSQNMKIGAADPATIVGLVRSQRIDLLGLDEFTPAAETALDDAGLLALLPFSASDPFLGATGSAIYSRYPLTGTGYQHLAGGFGQEYAAVTVPGALPLEFYAVHTRAPALPDTQADWAKSIEQEPAATPRGTVRLLAGDFNATFDQVRLRRLLATGYVDIASQLGDGMVTTWPYDGRLIPPVPITLDHMLADPRIGAVTFGAHKVPGTDHRAIYATLTLPPTHS
jgi:endonuclease/exonuclease/phosphatase (EEP) superfamily protein YafD